MVSLSQSLRRLAPAALSALIALTPAAHADQTDRIVFDVVLRGITAGKLSINGKIEGASYGANGTLQTSGLLGAFRKIRYDSTVTGSFIAGRFTPDRYVENADTPSRQSETVMVYKSGVPVSVSRVPARKPRKNDVDATTQRGTIDPLTALYAVLRDVDAAEACQLKVTLFDGARRTQVTLNSPQPAGDGVSCSGEYRRLEGFSDKDMAEKSRFPFTLTYASTEAGRLQVIEISTDTIYGKGRLKRR